MNGMEETPGPEPKPCPFCGSSNILGHHVYGKYGWLYYVECSSCGARTKAYRQINNKDIFDTPYRWEDFGYANAMEAWNRRATV